MPSFPRLWRCREVGFGAVCLRRTGIKAEVLADRFVAGETILQIAMDYLAVNVADVEEALRVVLAARGTSLTMGRAADKVEKLVPMETR